MYRYFISLMLCILSASGFLYAQENTILKARITLQNGDRLNGLIKMAPIPAYVTIYNLNGDSLIITSRQIQSVKLSRQYPKEIKSKENKQKQNRNNRKITYFNNTMVGVLSGKSAEDVEPVASLSAETVNGVTICSFLSTGIGVAYDQYNTTATLPFFITFRGDILSNPLTPFYFADVGYGSAWDTRETNVWEDLEVKGGLMFHTGIGFKMYSDDRINVMIALGYKYQKSEYRITEWGGVERVTDRTFKRLSFRLGIGF